MSVSARNLSSEAADELFRSGHLFRHCHSVGSFLAEYTRRATAAAAERKLPGLRAFAPHLLNIIFDEKTLRAAWDHLERHGSHAPGPDGYTYADFTPAQVWKHLRALRDEIRDGHYEPDEERITLIPKGSGRGFRELSVQSVFDRVVSRAATCVLTPLFDPLFDPHSFGFRPKMGPLRALATAERLCRGEHRTVWVSADIKNAFPSVPVPRLLQLLGRYLPDADLTAFLGRVIERPSGGGLRQGSPLSPLLLNLYLHHHLDRKWRDRHRDLPLLRFADDLLVLCRTPEEGRWAYASLTELLTPAGFTLKEGETEAVRSLADRRSVRWMGYSIRLGDGGPEYTVTPDAWVELADKFAGAHERPLSPLAAARSLSGWVADKGPCLPHTDFKRAYARLRRLGEEQGFDELPEDYEVKGWWTKAFDNWCKLKRTPGPATPRAK